MRTTIRTTMLNREKTLLIVLLLTTCLFTFAVSVAPGPSSRQVRHCVSEDGQSRKVCRGYRRCCDDDFGRAACCKRNSGVGGIIAYVIVSVFFLIPISCCCCTCWYFAIKRCTTACCTATTTGRVVATRRQTTIPQPPVRETSPNEAPSSHSDSNTNNIEAPPSYPANERSPSFSEVNI